MGISDRKNREKQERRNLILSKTRALVLENGVTSFTMKEIAAECELSKATLYLYFNSKETILSELFKNAANRFLDYVSPRVRGETSGLNALKKLWDSFIAFYTESEDLFVLIGIKNYLYPAFPLQITEGMEKNDQTTGHLVKLISDLLEGGMKDGTLDDTYPPFELAGTVIMLATGIVDEVARLPRPQRDTRLINTEMRKVFQILLRGLAAKDCDRSLLTLS